jgi:hypothetical protein
MIRYPFSEFKIVYSEDSRETPFILSKEQYKYFTKDEEEWNKCLGLIEANGFDSIYVVSSIQDKGKKVWEKTNGTI